MADLLLVFLRNDAASVFSLPPTLAAMRNYAVEQGALGGELLDVEEVKRFAAEDEAVYTEAMRYQQLMVSRVFSMESRLLSFPEFPAPRRRPPRPPTAEELPPSFTVVRAEDTTPQWTAHETAIEKAVEGHVELAADQVVACKNCGSTPPRAGCIPVPMTTKEAEALQASAREGVGVVVLRIPWG